MEQVEAFNPSSQYHNVVKKFEYLDHTADVQLHSWGDNVEEAFEQAVMAMFNYMTDINDIRPAKTVEIMAEGTDYMSLLFHFMDEFLFLASCDDFFMAREVKITKFDRENWRMEALGYGEDFNKERHGGKGTEVKAITYSAMKVLVEEAQTEIYVIVDI